ncbi:response regulator transcription factor [Hyphomicrobium sp.]|uniref:response regulator transcription factor n=1 Tax=Hyphomicrobium sp. TaxID=82 RepID=UPI000FA8BF30|nr:response regulator transcription factor [Hyphomicrobium sp.]RUO98249.1 MAG: response regulator transcription factor [Hyphomicrobium sp.]
MQSNRATLTLEKRIGHIEKGCHGVSTESRGQSSMNDEVVRNRSLNILVLTKNTGIADQIAQPFKAKSVAHEITTDASHGLKLAAAGYFDAVVVDTGFAVDGETWVSTLRNLESTTPCLLLLNREDLDDDVDAVTNDADDFLVKPFVVSELYTRLHMLARRPRKPSQPTILRFGDLEMNLISHQVVRGGRRIHLPRRQFQLLELLMKGRGRVVSRRAILDRLSDTTFDMGMSGVQANICRLRAQIDRVHETSLIRTVRGIGYSLHA